MTAIRIAPPRAFSSSAAPRTAALFAGLFCSDISGWLQMLVTTWLLWSGPHRAFWLVAFMVLRSVPKLVTAPFAGAVADRMCRLCLYHTCRLIAVLPPIGLALASSGLLPQHATIMTVAALGAVVAAFDQPARRGLLWDVGGPAGVVGTVSLSSAAFHSASSLSPALAVVLAGTLGTTGALEVAALFAGLSALSMWAFKRNGGIGARAETREASPHPLGAFHYLWRTPGVVVLLLLSTAPGLLGRAVAIVIPAVAGGHAHASLMNTGAMASAPGTGAFVAAVALAIAGEVADKSRFALVSAIVFVLSIVAVQFSPTATSHVLFLGMAGASSATFGAMIFSILHLRIPDHLRCRVMAL